MDEKTQSNTEAVKKKLNFREIAGDIGKAAADGVSKAAVVIDDLAGGEHSAFLFKGCDGLCVQVVALAEGQRHLEEKRSGFPRDDRIGRGAVQLKLV